MNDFADAFSTASPETLKHYVREYLQKSLTNAAWSIPNMVNAATILRANKEIRDQQLWELPILPGAVKVFQELASGREFAVSGKPKQVARAIEFLQKAETLDEKTGLREYGFQQFLQRRALDWLTIGRTAFAVRKNQTIPVLEYLDPTRLAWMDMRPRAFRNGIPQVTPETEGWEYLGGWVRYRVEDVTIFHPLPIGNRLFMAPVTFLLPTARLAWLLDQHDASSLDGRRIREIIFVGNATMDDAIKTALAQIVALNSGADPTKTGVPVVPISNPGGGKIADQIATLGISNIPAAFDRHNFTTRYANQISASLGVSLRQFWNDERSTNRALEVVQEQRQQQKGPSYFVRTEQRLINNSGILAPFGTPRQPVRFGFIEEVDTASRLDNARVLFETAQALEKVAMVFGATISPESLLAWMQSIGAIPNELELSSVEGAPFQASTVTETSDPSNMNSEGETTVSGDTAPSNLEQSTTGKNQKNRLTPDYGEITMNGDGEVIDRRVKVVSLAYPYIKSQIIREQKRKPTDTVPVRLSFQDEMLAVKIRKVAEFCATPLPETFDAWLEEQVYLNAEEVRATITKTRANQALTEQELDQVLFLVDAVKDLT